MREREPLVFGGIAATSVAFALSLIGREDLALYDGSMMEWAADPSLPAGGPGGGVAPGGGAP